MLILPCSQIAEVAQPTAECPHPERWHCYDGEATEVEVLEFLYSLVRMLRPNVVIETGAYKGFGTVYLAAGLRDGNKAGRVFSCEPNLYLQLQAIDFVCSQNLHQWVGAIENMTGASMLRKMQVMEVPVNFAFLDSGLTCRVNELRILWPNLVPGAFVAVHDTNTHHAKNGGPREELLSFAAEYASGCVPFDTPRGLTLLRR